MNERTPVLVVGARTPIGRLGGCLSRRTAVELGAAAVRAVVTTYDGITPDYVAMGNVVQAGNGQNPARIAAVRGGVDRRVPGITLNDVCLASMSAVGLAARMIAAGEITTALVGGFESMSGAPWAGYGDRGRAVPCDAREEGPTERVDLLVRDGLWCALDDIGMGPLSDAENGRLGIGRQAQDQYAAESHRRAARATETGRLAEEIRLGGLTGPARDEGIRPNSSVTALGRLAPAFTETGTITAGNASQLSDAAGAGLLTTVDHASARGVEPLVAVEGAVVVAGPDSGLHLMPALAAKTLLDRHGMAARQIGLWEINEAFAGVVIASMRDLDLDHDRVNVNGGAVALGHPLGATGFRLVLTLAHEMRRRGVEWGVAAICGGGGQGQALLLRCL